MEVFDGDDAPDAADKKFLKLPDKLVRNFDIFGAKVCEQRFIGIATLIQVNCNLVDNLVAAAFANFRLYFFGFIRTDVIFGQNALNSLKSVANGRLVVRRAIHSQQILQDIDRNVRALLDELGQVLTDDLPREVRIQQRVDIVGHMGLRTQNSSMKAMLMETSTRPSSA